jgi:hypothetical protein
MTCPPVSECWPLTLILTIARRSRTAVSTRPSGPDASPVPDGSRGPFRHGDLRSERPHGHGWLAGCDGPDGRLADADECGHAPCVVDGSPRLIQLRAGGAILDSVTYEAGKDAGPGNSTGVAGPVLLQPGDQAGAFLAWSNWCPEMIPIVTALLVTLPSSGSPIVASPTSPGPGLGSTPRCDQPSSGSTFTAYAFVSVPPPTPVYEPQAASVVLSVPPTATAGGDLAFTVTLANRGSNPAVLSPCPTYTEDLIVDGRALKPPAPQQFLLNCAATGNSLAPGASITLQMHYIVPASIPPGPVELVWGMDPGGRFDASTAVQRATVTVVGP